MSLWTYSAFVHFLYSSQRVFTVPAISSPSSLGSSTTKSVPPVFKGALIFGLAPKDFVVAVGVERRVNVNQINAGAGQFGELFQIVAAINNAGIEKGAWAWDRHLASLILF